MVRRLDRRRSWFSLEKKVQKQDLKILKLMERIDLALEHIYNLEKLAEKWDKRIQALEEEVEELKPKVCQCCQKFVCFYLFFSLQTLSSHEHSSSHTCSHFCYAPTTCCFPFILFCFHHSHQDQTIENTSEVDLDDYQRQELSTREALHEVPSPIRYHIARLCQSTASTPTPPQTCDETLYLEVSSPRGLPTTTIPHDRMKR